MSAVLDELLAQQGVYTFVAVLKARNFRSDALLRHLGFEQADLQLQTQYHDELVMVRQAAFGAS